MNTANAQNGRAGGRKDGSKRITAPVKGAQHSVHAVYFFRETGSNAVHLKRTELIEMAQEFCDASFTQTPDGSHYTAWSSMSTLIKKKLITKEGSPARYALTISGEELCKRLVSVEDGTNMQLHLRQEDVDDPDPVSADNICGDLELQPMSSLGNTKQTKENITNERNTLGNIEIDMTGSSLISPNKKSQDDWRGIAFSYIDERGLETPQKDRAVVSVEDDGFIGFLIKCRLTQLLTSNLNYVLDNSRDAPIGFTYAFLENSQSPSISPGLHSPTKLGLSFKEKKKVSPQVDSSCMDAYPNETAKKRKSNKTTNKENATVRVSAHFRNHLVSEISSITTISPKLSQNTISSQVSAQSSSQNSGRVAQSMASTPIQPQFSLPVGTYEILLCVDNAEVAGGYSNGKKNQKDIIISELRKHRVTFDVRKLHVGDFLWVAREKQLTYGGTGVLSQPRELVLPYVIERKRMDDLASSIKDGRFREQKFRLKQSGLSRPMYLVEQYGSQNSGLPESTCEQAVVNTQVVDGFLVKWTKDQRESAAFLTIMTRSLQSIYQGHTVITLGRHHADDLDCDFEEIQLLTHTALGCAVLGRFAPFPSESDAGGVSRHVRARVLVTVSTQMVSGLCVMDRAKLLV
ncbi:unnamed protein product, partial [Meganyctiphanes norvegica]